MKRVLSVVLILATVLSCVCFCAYAESEAINGVYNNYSYYCYGIVSTTSAQVWMKYGNSTTSLRIDGTYKYYNIKGQLSSKSILFTGKTNLLATPVASDFASFSSLHPTFHIGSYVAATMSLSA